MQRGVRLTQLCETVSAQFTEAFDAVEEAARTLRWQLPMAKGSRAVAAVEDAMEQLV